MFCGHKGSIQCIVFDVASTYERFTFHFNLIYRWILITVHKNNKLFSFASCSTDNTLILWLFSTGEKLHVFECDASTNDAVKFQFLHNLMTRILEYGIDA